MFKSVWIYQWSPCLFRSQLRDLLRSASLRPSSPSAALFPSSWLEKEQEVRSVTQIPTNVNNTRPEKDSQPLQHLVKLQQTLKV